MRLRTYLILSYVALIVILFGGAWFIDARVMGDLTKNSIRIADQAVTSVTAAHVQHSDDILTRIGQYVVKDKAEDVAREMAYVLKGKKLDDYAKLRRDPVLRAVAIQDIYTPDGPAGYTDLYDRRGYILFHPDKNVEGRNQLDWEKEYPETTELIKRSLTENRVQGFFTFFDKDKKERKRFSVRVHVPGTPFIVAAIVNLDQYFTPSQQRMKESCQIATVQAKQQIEAHYAALNREVMIGGLFAGLALCLVGGLSGFYFAAAISRPISRLRDGVRQVGEGDFAVAVPVRGVREVADLAVSFNDLGKQLTEYIEKRDFIRDTFGRYVTQEVVTKLLESEGALDMGGDIREVSLIMSDLRGFTAIIAEMEPEQVITFLNRYLSKMIAILLDNRAVIDEILGDGILAFFGAPEPREDHPARAVACALSMQAAMDEINAENEAEGLPRLAMGIGVNTGSVVVGNIGSERRTKYSVVGSDVNFVSRLEAFALAGQVLISAATYSRVRDLVEVANVLTVEMKGMPGRATLYDVRSMGAPYNIRLPDKSEQLAELPEAIGVRIHRLKNKIITDVSGRAWVTHLCDTAARVTSESALEAWEDLRLAFLDDNQEPTPGHIYGKVTRVKPLTDGRFEVLINFTSVPAGILRTFGRHTGTA
ncbi:MAG: HAMP domain-containing protein [Desulfobacterales bacterium]|nr:HAMP domain-containing protein [Pseudomonadota bacterium]MCG2772248.1 HAMP domain-containing protein [Desulfobacterales bacterium]